MNAKRGYVPEDDRNFSAGAVETMRMASRQIIYLINEGYDLKQASTFVGNHYVLSKRQRLALMRSVATNEQLKTRREKQKFQIDGEEVWVDGFNTIITLEVMHSNSILFIGQDGAVRDLAALRGTYKIIPQTEAAINTLFESMQEMNVASVHILLDEPVSNSGRLKSLLADISLNYSFDLDIQILKAVDRELWEKENVITSDSIILDHCKSWINLIEKCVKKNGTRFFKVWE